MANNLYKADLAAMSGLKEAMISLRAFAAKIRECLNFVYAERDKLEKNYRDFVCAESPATYGDKRDARKLNYDICQLFNELVPHYWNIPRLNDWRRKK